MNIINEIRETLIKQQAELINKSKESELITQLLRQEISMINKSLLDLNKKIAELKRDIQEFTRLKNILFGALAVLSIIYSLILKFF